MVLRKRHILAAIIFCAAVIALPMLKNGLDSRQTFENNQLTVVLDAGHGEPDGGAVGVNGTIEKDINLAIVEKLQEILEGKGIAVVLTREGDSGLQDEEADTIREMKKSDMLKRREIVSQSGADLFLSIHMNSFSDSSVNGLHIFYDKAHPKTEETAKKIQAEIADVTGAPAHTVKTADENLFLMKNPAVPSILIECGFLSNPEEEKKLNDEEYQSKIAWAIAKAVVNYTN